MPLHEPDPKRQRLILDCGLVLHSITADAQEGGFAETLNAERALSCREKKIPTPLFPRRLSPAEAQTGVSSDLRLGIGWSTVFSRVEIEPLALHENLVSLKRLHRFAI